MLCWSLPGNRIGGRTVLSCTEIYDTWLIVRFLSSFYSWQPIALLKIELNDSCEVITIAQFRYDVLSASSVQFGRLYWSEFEFKDEKGGEVQLTVMNCALYCSMEA